MSYHSNRSSIISHINIESIHPLITSQNLTNLQTSLQLEKYNLFESCPIGKKIQCRIVRKRCPGGYNYELFLEEGNQLSFLLRAYKKKNYFISSSKIPNQYCAQLKSNFLGTNYTILDNHSKTSIIYVHFS